jgi:hypothetical protein
MQNKGVLEYNGFSSFKYVNKKLVQDKNATLVHELTKIHPKGICEIEEGKADNCFNFLSVYLEQGAVFTLNYDLLLYWASIRAIKTMTDLYRDGFSTLNSTGNGWIWADKDNTNIFYCHGALNLYSANSRCFKTSHDQLCFLPIKEKLERGYNPLYVSANTSEKKLERIEKSNYLSSCLRALKSISGILVVIGFSASENDKHILNAIKEAQSINSLKIYFGVYDSSKLDEISQTLDNCGLQGYELFDSKTALIWKNEQS